MHRMQRFAMHDKMVVCASCGAVTSNKSLISPQYFCVVVGDVWPSCEVVRCCRQEMTASLQHFTGQLNYSDLVIKLGLG